MHRRDALTCLLAAGALRAENWPEFRGLTAQGHSTERGLPLTWSPTENVRWRTPVAGTGWSTPSILGDRIWLTSAADGGRSLRALCLDRNSGKTLHDVEVFRLDAVTGVHKKNNPASPTPILEGERVYVHFGYFGTACLDTGGKIVWKSQTLKYQPQHGPGGSPALYKDLLIVSCDGFDAQYVAALDKNTGAVKWKTPRSRGNQAYTTPLVITVDGKDQVISPGAFKAMSYEPSTGKELWAIDYGDGFSNVPRAVYGHGLVFICSGFFQPVLFAVKPTGRGDVTKSHVVWTANRGVPLTPSPLIVGDEFYMVSDNGIASCLDAKTGKMHWQERLGGNHSASPVFADGRIYFLSEEGETTVIEPSKEFRRLAVNKIGERTLASLAISGGAIFLRGDSHLYRLELPARA